MIILRPWKMKSKLYQAAFKKITRRQGGGDEGVHNQYAREPTTKPMRLAFECRLVLIIVCLLFIFTTGAKAEIIDKIVAKVNDEIITLYDLQKLKSTLPAYPEMYEAYLNFETEKEKDYFLLDMLINEKLVIEEIKKYGIFASDDEVKIAIEDLASQNEMSYEDFIKNISVRGIKESDYKDMIKKQIGKMKFFGRFINSKVTITEKEILTFFRNNRKFLKSNQKISFFHVLFLKGDIETDEPKKLTKDFIKRLKEGGSFEEEAASLSENPIVKVTGRVTARRKELAKEFMGPVNELKPKEVSDIIENDAGYNVIMLDEVETISLDSYKERIRQQIQSEKREEMYKSIIGKLRQKYSIEVRY
jgi:peptidyl-prolyl cis-trans isomerase SurA